MIRYDLVCTSGHRFDAWFRNSADFDRQAADGFLACPACGDARIAKALMTPGVRTARGRPEPPAKDGQAPRAAPPSPPPAPARPTEMVQAAMHQAAMRQMLVAMHNHVTRTARDVGKDFAREARRIHEGEAPEEGIYGQATQEEVDDLLEDGIAVMPLPVPPKADA